MRLRLPAAFARVVLLACMAVLFEVSPVHAQAASIATISPASASYGELVTITGVGFGGTNVQIAVGSVPARVESASGSTVAFRVPTGVPIGRTTVTATNPSSRSTGSIGFEISGAVYLTLDTDHGASAVIGSDGGVVTAQSNGRTYRLSVPPGALGAPETIMMTPILSMLGLPLERLIGSVHFAPEGLQFFKPATLLITVPKNTNTKGLIGFSADGAGESLHLAPFAVTEALEISLVVPHFSIGGAAAASAGAAAAVACTQPTVECRYVNALALAQQQAIISVCGVGCTADDFMDHVDAIYDAIGAAFIPLLGQWFDEVLQLLQTTGVADDAGLTSAGRQYLAWKAYLQASACSSTRECGDIDSLKAKLQSGETAFGAAYLAALQRAKTACNDRRVFGLLTEVDQNGIYGKGGLPADLGGGRAMFACQLSITPTFPNVVHMNDTVPFTAGIRVQSVGGGSSSPLQYTTALLFISDGCGNFVGGGTVKQTTTDASGQVAADIRIVNSCTNTIAATEISVRVDDVKDAAGELIAFGRTVKVRASIPIQIVVTPQDATVVAGATLAFSAEVNGTVQNMTWTATGGAITPGPSPTATYTAGSAPGVYNVTARLAADPSLSQTVAVTISANAATVLKGLNASIETRVSGTCFITYNSFGQPLSSCPDGIRSDTNFTEFHQQQKTTAEVEPATTEHGRLTTQGVAVLDVSLSAGGAISGSGSTMSAVFQDYDGAPGAQAKGVAKFTVEIQVVGKPANYDLQSSFNCDSYPTDAASGSCQISFQFASESVSIGPYESASKSLFKKGTLQPGTYQLTFYADSVNVEGRPKNAFHTSWGFVIYLSQ